MAAVHQAFAALALLIVGIAFSLPFVIACWVAILSYGRDLGQLVLLFPRRRRPIAIASMLIALLVYATAAALLGVAHLTAILFAMGAVVPWGAMLAVRLYAWWTDTAEQRAGAVLAHNAEAVRVETRPVSVDRRLPWSTYLVDVERARRQQEYDPPPI